MAGAMVGQVGQVGLFGPVGHRRTRTSTDEHRRTRTRAAVMGLTERVLLREEVESGRAAVLYFVPERHFYGGHLIYRLGESREQKPETRDQKGGEERLFRQWAGNETVRRVAPETLVTESI